MRHGARLVLPLALSAAVASVACGSKREGGYSPNNPGVGGGGNATGNGGTGGSGNGGSGGSGNGGSGNFGGGSPGCDATKSPAEDACVIHETYAVFVSPLGDDLEGDGSRGKPYKTMDVAVSSAAAKKKRVYACATAGAFDGLITLDSYADGVSLYGGFDCTKWDYKAETRTELNGPATGVIEIQGLTLGTTVEDFVVKAKNATTPAGASIGILVSSSKNVMLRRLEVSAGAGAPGVTGYTSPGVASSGKPGNPGKAACSTSVLGGNEVSSGCGFPESLGAYGGDGGIGTTKPTSGFEGEPHLGGGLGGKGQDDLLPGGWSCSSVGNGQNGQPGKDGEAGLGSKSAGSLTASGWVASAGGIGENGANGQGGGGGGGAKAPSTCGTAPNPPHGASGGSGGSGGCGGLGGEGGKGGGASIALASYDSQITLDDTKLVASGGGSGGAGGTGQLGGNGANGASGGSGACSGGNGAKGGNGGHAGGGAGGPSIGVAFKGTKPTRVGGGITIASVASAGGADGTGQMTGTGVGAAGVLANEQEYQ